MKRAILLFAAVLMLLGAALSCTAPEEPSEEASAVFEAEVSPGAKAEWRVFCRKCGHAFTYSDASKVIGLSKAELERRLPDWSIAAFSREYVRLTKTMDVYCPDHYILYMRGGKLTVTTPVAPELNEEELASFTSERYSFPDKELERMTKGLAFDSLLEVENYISRYKKQGG